jgi:hypothetical protein
VDNSVDEAARRGAFSQPDCIFVTLIKNEQAFLACFFKVCHGAFMEQLGALARNSLILRSGPCTRE